MNVCVCVYVFNICYKLKFNENKKILKHFLKQPIKDGEMKKNKNVKSI